jgi:hypothetical protein
MEERFFALLRMTKTPGGLLLLLGLLQFIERNVVLANHFRQLPAGFEPVDALAVPGIDVRFRIVDGDGPSRVFPMDEILPLPWNIALFPRRVNQVSSCKESRVSSRASRWPRYGDQ